MKFTTLLAAFAFLAGASAFPSTVKEFPWNDALKASIQPDKLESIQKFLNKVQNSELPQRTMLDENTASEMTELECLNYHLENISVINQRSGVEVRACGQSYLNTTEALEKAALKAKVNNDKSISTIAKKLTSCEKHKDSEKGLECQANLKSNADAITNLSNEAKRTLDEHKNSKQKAVLVKNWCINDSVTKANQEINAEHEQLLLC